MHVVCVHWGAKEGVQDVGCASAEGVGAEAQMHVHSDN